MNWMNAFLGCGHGWGQQRVAARRGVAVPPESRGTQVGGNSGGLPLSVAGMRPSKTGKFHGRRGVCAMQDGCEPTQERIDADSRTKIGDLGNKAESETTEQISRCFGLRLATGLSLALKRGRPFLSRQVSNPVAAYLSSVSVIDIHPDK